MYGLVIAVALASPAQPGDANKYLDRTKLDERLDLLADQIADVLTSRKAGELKVADVVCATDADDPHAAWLQRDMTVRFERRKVKVADVAKRAVLASVAAHPGRVRGLVVSPKGDSFVTVGADREVKAWSLAAGVTALKPTRVWALPVDVTALAYTPDGRSVVTANADGTAYVLALP